MSKFDNELISLRFLEVVDEIQRLKFVGSDSEFSRLTNFSKQGISAIRKEKRKVTIDLIVKTFDVFKGSPLYILCGIGPKIITPELLNMIILNDALKIQEYNKNALTALEKIVQMMSNKG